MKLRFGFVSVLLLCLGLCSSCEDERFDTGSTMPDGQFIVDYTAEAGKATRALHENVPAGERINSLTYLLYSEDGTLLKRREVPGLNEPGKVEEWPLTRENMTWKQREALKDTLETNITYHAVFIANIDSTKLWNNGTSSPLKRAGNYDDAYIELPDRAFTAISNCPTVPLPIEICSITSRKTLIRQTKEPIAINLTIAMSSSTASSPAPTSSLRNCRYGKDCW